MRSVLFAGVMIALSTVGACAKPPRLAGGPIDLTATPTVVRFDEPIPSSHPIWDVCFEFDTPGGSDAAARLRVALHAASGAHLALQDVTVDRRGERDVCLTGRPAPPAGAGARDDVPAVYDGLELSSDTPVRLRQIYGGGRRQ